MNQLQEQPTFMEGVRSGLPICLGYISVSFAFGMLAVQKGLALWSPMAISLTNFTGTGQFAGIDLIASGATYLEIAFTLFIINLRYLLMSFSLSQKISPEVTVWQRLIIAFGNTDEIFAVAMQRKELLHFRYMLGLIFISFFGWNFGTILGAVASASLPDSIRSALGIALYAMFIAIIIPAFSDSKPIAKIICIAVVMSCMFYFIPGLNQLSSGWVIIICGIVSSAWGAYFHPVATEGGANDGTV